MRQRRVIGVDVGATNTRVGLVEAEGLAILREERFATPRPPEQFTRRLAEAVRALGDEPLGVGIGMAGLISPATGTILFSPNLPEWRDVPLGPELSRMVGLPVIVENDANMAALGEQRAGAARGLNHLVCLTLGTGVGGGFILGGRLYSGATGQAGEVGHLIIERRGGAPCACGRRGCLEAVASATGLVRLAREGLGRGRKSVLAERDELSAAGIARAAEGGDRFARGLYARLGTALGFALGNLFNLLDLEAAVLTGGVAAAWGLFMPRLERELQRTLLPRKQARVLRGALPDTAGIIGAACHALDSLGRADERQP